MILKERILWRGPGVLHLWVESRLRVVGPGEIVAGARELAELGAARIAELVASGTAEILVEGADPGSPELSDLTRAEAEGIVKKAVSDSRAAAGGPQLEVREAKEALHLPGSMPNRGPLSEALGGVLPLSMRS